jgi:hypothetical protein
MKIAAVVVANSFIFDAEPAGAIRRPCLVSVAETARERPGSDKYYMEAERTVVFVGQARIDPSV